MPQPPVYLDESQHQALEELAASADVTVEDLLRRVIADYLERRQAEAAEWAGRFDRLVDRLGASVPAGLPEAEIEADVTAAITEVRQARRAWPASPAEGRAVRHRYQPMA